MSEKRGSLLTAATFFLPFFLLLGIFAALGLAPFGDRSLLVSDAQGQYLSYFALYQDLFAGKADWFYSFGKLLGGSLSGLFAYYLASEKTQPTLFIFDEPTTGLHFHDISILLRAFQALIDHGHTIVIIEHNMEIIKCADHIIDLGPEGGDLGGQIVAQGTPEQVAQCPGSHTAKFLREKL